METIICKDYNQTSFLDNLKNFEGKQVCPACYTRLYFQKYGTENIDKLAIKIKIGSLFTDYDEVILPLSDNLLDAMIFVEDYENLIDAFEELKNKWMQDKWGYNGNISEMELISAPELSNYDTIKCDELDFWIYTELSIKSELYDTPFDNSPAGYYFSCYFAEECYKGQIYSKDFAYSYCESCGRHICEQNPSNGWHSQGHFSDDGFECNKCYEERTLKEGINEDFDGNSIPGQFYNASDISANNWVECGYYQAGSGHSNYVSPDKSVKFIQELIDSGKKVLVDYGSMAIGGLGGYFTIYTK